MPRLARAMDKWGPRYLIDPPRGAGRTVIDPQVHLDPVELFGRNAPTIIEIGSGLGDQAVAYAAAHPQINLLAFEVWLPGIAQTIRKAGKATPGTPLGHELGLDGPGIDNLRIIEADAVDALECFDARSIAQVWSFFPDPWPKARHHKRRLVSQPVARRIARILSDDGRWRIATDWADYAEQCREVLAIEPGERFAGRIVTHFEQRAIAEGREIFDFCITAAQLAERFPDQDAG